MKALRIALVLASTAALSCGGPAASFGPEKVEIPATDGMPKEPQAEGPARESPPPSGEAKEAPFPAVSRARLPNGMDLAVVPAHALPIVQVRLFVRAGVGFGATPAVATLTGDMLKEGGTRTMSSAELARRVETLGSSLSVSTDLDGTTLSMPLTRDHLTEGLRILAQVVREPRFGATDLTRLKARASDEVRDAARSSGSFGATHVIFDALFADASPYATVGLLPNDIAKVDGAAIRAFHKRFYVPKATTLVLAGDVDPKAAKALASADFGGWKGEAPPKLEFPAPRVPDGPRVVVVDRPKSVQSDVYVAMLAPARDDASWAHVRVANQILGGGVASRLFTDVRERRSLAYRTGAHVAELAHGAQPLIAYAGTETEKTLESARALLENLAKMKVSPPTDRETATARRYLSDIFAVRMETIGAIADMVVLQEELGLPDGYWDTYRAELRRTTAAEAAEAADAMYTPERALVVVAGDAEAIGPDLSHLGDVRVVDPEDAFKVVRTIPRAASAKK